MSTKQPIISKLEYLLKVAPEADFDEISWHLIASTSILDGEDLPRKLLKSGKNTLAEFSTKKLGRLLHETPLKRKHLDAIRNQRKILMIARDAIFLCAQDPLPPAIDPLFSLVRGLGQIADTDGIVKKPIKCSRRNVGAPRVASRLPLKAVSEEVLAGRINDRVFDQYLLGEGPFDNENAYHQSRREFRRVTNLSLLACAVSPSASRIAFAASGRMLNNKYGERQAELFSGNEAAEAL